MPDKSRRYNFLISFMLSFILLIIGVALIPMGGKYRLSELASHPKSPNDIEIYHDIDKDGDSEYFRFVKDFVGVPAVIGERAGTILFQWNLKGDFATRDFYCFEDCNADSVQELFVITYRSDSIFLYGFDIHAEQPFMGEIFISTFRHHGETADFWVTEPIFVDLDHSNRKKLLITLFCAFSYTTRKQCLVDLETRKLTFSPVAGTAIRDKRFIFDLDQDGKMEIFGDVPILGNTKPDYPFTDQFGWLMVYDHQLNFKFPPVQIGKYSGAISVWPLKTETENLLAVWSLNTTQTDSCFIALYNIRGELVRSKKLAYDKSLRGTYFKTFPDGHPTKMALYRSSGLIETYDEKLNLVNTHQSYPFATVFESLELEVDGNGAKEAVFWCGNSDQLVVARNDLSGGVSTGINPTGTNTWYFSCQKALNKHPLLFLSADKTNYTFAYHKNWLHTFRFLIWAIGFILIFLLVHSIGKLYQFTLKQRYNAETQIRHYQIKAIEQQLNPHFTLNILNDIGALYEKHETKAAQYYFGKYSKLLRTILISSGQISTSLAQEAEFTRTFLELEQFRLNQAFLFTVEIPDIAAAVTVPRLLVHIFVENAIKHGIRPLIGEKMCSINIFAERQQENLLLTIQDDGIGRKLAGKAKNKSTGKGLKIVANSLKLYEQMEGKRISFKLSDLNNHPQYPGTKIIITIPM
jgi:hypothetical protein